MMLLSAPALCRSFVCLCVLAALAAWQYAMGQPPALALRHHVHCLILMSTIISSTMSHSPSSARSSSSPPPLYIMLRRLVPSSSSPSTSSLLLRTTTTPSRGFAAAATAGAVAAQRVHHNNKHNGEESLLHAAVRPVPCPLSTLIPLPRRSLTANYSQHLSPLLFLPLSLPFPISSMAPLCPPRPEGGSRCATPPRKNCSDACRRARRER